jgi:hypothetical protein
MWLWITWLALAPLAAGQSPTPSPPEPPKSARVSGIVIDQQENRPLSHVLVCFSPVRKGPDSASSSRCDETDARGSFNLPGLRPGRFTYSADRNGYFGSEPLADGLPLLVDLSAGDEIRDIKLRMSRAGVIAGRVVYADGEPYRGAALASNGRPGADPPRTVTNDLGEYRLANLWPGDYSVVVQSRVPFPASCEEFPTVNPRIYVAESADRPAPPVHVGVGQTMIQPDLVMIQVTPRRVTGRIVWDPYPLPRPWLVHVANSAAVIAQSNLSDGTFSFCGVPPGEYTLQIGAVYEGRTIVGDVKIRVGDEDLKDVEIVPEASAVIRAGIDVEDDVPLDLSRIRIDVTSNGPNPHDYTASADPQPDGTYLIQDLFNAEYRFSLSALPPGTYLKSVELEGRELIDAPLMVQGGDTIDGLIFTVSAKAGSLNGVVQNENGLAVPDALVMLQPDPRHADPDIHRCLQTADQNGAFTCSNLAPGKYRIAAWRKFPDQLAVQGVGDAVSSSGTPVEIPESGQVAITVPLVKP